MIFMYKFKDGSIYKLIDKGFSLNDIWVLEEIHGELIEQSTSGVRKND